MKLIPRFIEKPFKTGQSAAKRSSEQVIALAKNQKEATDRKTAKERKKANKILIRGFRSKRAGGYFSGGSSEGRTTIG